VEMLCNTTVAISIVAKWTLEAPHLGVMYGETDGGERVPDSYPCRRFHDVQDGGGDKKQAPQRNPTQGL